MCPSKVVDEWKLLNSKVNQDELPDNDVLDNDSLKLFLQRHARWTKDIDIVERDVASAWENLKVETMHAQQTVLTAFESVFGLRLVILISIMGFEDV